MRLTNAKREEIIKAVISSKFGKKEDELKGELGKLAEDRLIEEEKRVFDGVNFKNLEQYFYGTRGYVRFREAAFHGIDFHVSLKISRHRKRDSEEFFLYKYDENRQSVDPAFRMTGKMASLFEQYKRLSDERQGVRNDLKAVLYSCNTAKQLMEVLPELEEFFPEDGKAGLPMVSTEIVGRLKSWL